MQERVRVTYKGIVGHLYTEMDIHVHVHVHVQHTHFLPGVACCLCGVVTVRDPPTVGEEKRGVEVGMGDREDGWTEDEESGDAWGISKTGPAAVVLVPGMEM